MINDDIAYKDVTDYCYFIIIIIIIIHIIIIVTIIIIIIVIIIISRDGVTSWKSTPVGYTTRQLANPCTRGGILNTRPVMILRTASSAEVAEMLAEEFLPGERSDDGAMSSNVTTSGGSLAVTKDTP